MFDRLEKTSYPELIAQRIRSLILDRQLGAGDRLPSERAMSEQFGVSRSSIREGIKLLNALGWVDIRIGDGIYVSSNLSQSVLESLSWAIVLTESVASELIEARMVIEPQIAAFAAERATDGDKANIQETIDRMQRHMGNVEEVIRADMDFHLAIAKAARNQILYQTLVGLQQIMRSHIAQFYVSQREQEQALADHRLIFDAILQGDSHAAHAAMTAGIVKVNVAEAPPAASTNVQRSVSG